MCANNLAGMAPRLLIVDANPAICYTLQHILEHYGYSVCATTDVRIARTLLGDEAFDLLLIAPLAASPAAAAEFLHCAHAQQPAAALALLGDGCDAAPLGWGHLAYSHTTLDRHASPVTIATGVAQVLSERDVPLAMLELGR